MASTCLAKQTASRELPQNWLVKLGIDVAAFCDMWTSKQPHLRPFGYFFELEPHMTLWLPNAPQPPTL